VAADDNVGFRLQPYSARLFYLTGHAAHHCTVANPHVVRSLGSKQTHILSHSRGEKVYPAKKLFKPFPQTSLSVTKNIKYQLVYCLSVYNMITITYCRPYLPIFAFSTGSAPHCICIAHYYAEFWRRNRNLLIGPTGLIGSS